jgi:hypothetical protein
VSQVDYAANLGVRYDRKTAGKRNAWQYWLNHARPHPTRTLQRLSDNQAAFFKSIGEPVPTRDSPVPVLLVEDDDTSMFNKYKRTMLLMHFVNDDVDEMTADNMEKKWQELLKRDDVVSKSTFINRKPFNIFARYLIAIELFLLSYSVH